jgi:peptidyl-prolyl cis-trans isomerase D
MAAIGSIRKHGVLLMVIIGFALVLFLLTGLFDGNTLYRVFASDQYTMGEIDGQNVNDQYNTSFEKSVAFMKVMNDRESFTETENFQIHQYTWNQMVTEMLLDKELEKLGVIFHDELKETLISDAVASITTEKAHPYFSAYAQYLIPKIGIENVLGFISNIEEYRTYDWAQSLYIAYKGMEDAFFLQKKIDIYLGLSKGSIYYSNALAERLAENNKIAMGNLLTINPNMEMFKGVNVDVTDKELKAFFEENKERYFVKEENRDIELAVLPILPTPQDKEEIEANVQAKYQTFMAVSTIDSFNRKEMYSSIDSSFHKKGDPIVINTPNGYMKMSINSLDSLIYDVPTGKMIEPYNVDDNVWFFGKTFGAESRPDSILVACLVLDYKTSQNQNSTRTKKLARHEADSLKNVILSGQSTIFALLPNYLGNRKENTDTTIWYEEQSVPLKLYNELIKTPAGGVYIDNIASAFVVYQVLERTVPVPKRQYALYAFDIKASDNTINSLRTTANQIASASTSVEDLVTEANSKGVQIISGMNITSMSASINTVQDCRTIVHWAFDKEREVNQVSEVFKLSDQMFVVAALKKINPKGTPKFENVKEQITAELQTKKKIEAVEAMIKGEASSSMASIATKYNANLMDSVRFTFAGESYQNYGLDNMAIGKLFADPTIGGNKVISGKNMVYMVSLYNVENQPASPNFQMEKSLLRNILLGYSRNEMMIIEGLKDKANIWDNRSRFYR